MKRYLALAALAALAVVVGCGSPAAAPRVGIAAVQATHAEQVCRGLARITADFDSGLYVFWGDRVATVLAPSETATQVRNGYFSNRVIVDIANVVSPLDTQHPSASAVAALQRDCDSVGVRSRVWPAALTG